MTFTRKDVLATVFTALVALVFVITHKGWDVSLIGDSHRWAAAVITLIGAVTCGLGSTERLADHKLAATLGWTSLPVLRLIRARTLVIAGTDDPILPTANATILGRGLPDARVHHHPGGHLAIVTEARELAGVAAEFLGAP